EATLGGADAEGRERHPALVEDGEEVREAAAALPQQVLLGHAHVLEQQRVGVRGVPAHLVVAGAGGEPGGVGGDDDAAQLRAGAAVGTGAPPGDGGDGDQGGDRGAGGGDELLGPVQHPLPVLEPGGGAGAAGIGDGPGPGEPGGGGGLGAGQGRGAPQ